MQSNEQWLPVVGYEGFYEVSDQGRVRSVDRYVDCASGYRRFFQGRIRVPRRDKNGYLRVNLSRGPECRAMRVHHLVLESFVGPKPDGMFGCHGNDVPDDNRLENLRWDTPKSNTADRDRNGRNSNANKTHCKRGHEFTEENTRTYRGMRFCRACMRWHDSNRRRKSA